VYFRDVQHLVNVAMQALFYSMPVVYPITVVEQVSADHGTYLGLHIIDIYRLNPLVRMVEAYRDVLYDMRWPSFADVSYFAAWSFGLCVLGMFMFRRFERRLPEEL
jgi:lipopolysaccharide transport system permease protein